jgi:hypothetical protein
MSDRLEDVVHMGVLRAQQGSLNLAYLRDWAVRLALTDLLDRATAEVGA